MRPKFRRAERAFLENAKIQALREQKSSHRLHGMRCLATEARYQRAGGAPGRPSAGHLLNPGLLASQEDAVGSRQVHVRGRNGRSEVAHQGLPRSLVRLKTGSFVGGWSGGPKLSAAPPPRQAASLRPFFAGGQSQNAAPHASTPKNGDYNSGVLRTCSQTARRGRFNLDVGFANDSRISPDCRTRTLPVVPWASYEPEDRPSGARRRYGQARGPEPRRSFFGD